MPYFLSMKSTLKITAKGQVTLRKRLMEKLGVSPGDAITVEVVEPGRAELKAAQATGSFEGYFGMLATPDTPRLTVEEINRLIASGWAGEL